MGFPRAGAHPRPVGMRRAGVLGFCGSPQSLPRRTPERRGLLSPPSALPCPRLNRGAGGQPAGATPAR